MSDENRLNGTKLEFLTGLADYLGELTEANMRLLSALDDYQILLVKDDTSSIEQASPHLDRLTGEIRCLDEARRVYVDDFFRKQNWDGPRNFTAIKERLSESGVTDDEATAFERMSKARAELIEALAEVDAQNSLNITLIGQSLSLAEISLRALLGCDEKKMDYGPEGDAEDGPSLLDAHA